MKEEGWSGMEEETKREMGRLVREGHGVAWVHVMHVPLPQTKLSR